MKTLFAIVVLLAAACSKAPVPAPIAAPPPKLAEDIPPTPAAARAPEPEAPPAVDDRTFSVRPKADKSTGHDLVAFVGRLGDLETLTEAHLSEEAPKDLRPLRANDDLNLFLLWGRRKDSLPKNALTVAPMIGRFHVTATWKYAGFGGMTDTGGVDYVGYGVRLGPIPAGHYVAEVYENTRDPEEGRRRTASITFEVIESPGPKEPEPPPVAGKEPPRLTCEAGCCVGMHTFKLGIR